jgi:hypothetical protein
MIKIILGLFIFYEFYVIFSRRHPTIGVIRKLNTDSASSEAFSPFSGGF